MMTHAKAKHDPRPVRMVCNPRRGRDRTAFCSGRYRARARAGIVTRRAAPWCFGQRAPEVYPRLPGQSNIRRQDDPTRTQVNIDPEVFYREFLVTDPAYAVVAHVLDRLRGEMQLLLGRNALSLGDFIDMTSIEYGPHGEVVPRDEEFLKCLAKAMKTVDVNRETLRRAATSGLTPEQIAEGPTSIRVPVACLRDPEGFRSFLSSLSPEYRRCPDFCALIRRIYGLKIHQKTVFLLFDGKDDLTAYFYPSRNMQQMRDRILSRRNPLTVDIYNAKSPVSTFCSLVAKRPEGHVKIIYLGRRET